MTTGPLQSNGIPTREVLANPYAFYTELRSYGRITFQETLNAWVVPHYHDVRAALTHPGLTSDRTAAYLSSLPLQERSRFEAFARFRADMPLFCDGEKHARLRRIVDLALHNAVHEANPWVQELADLYVNALPLDAPFDLIAQLGEPMPLAVLVRLLGFPPSDAPFLRDCALTFNRAIGGVIDVRLVEEAQKALGRLEQYLESRVDYAKSRSSTFTTLATEAGQHASTSEFVAILMTLVVAGHETTTNFIANSVAVLSTEPSRWVGFGERPVPALEELLRFDAPVQLTTRATTDACMLFGAELGAEERVILLWGSANHDPTVFFEPERLDLARKPNAHLAFGLGSHRCPGSTLARLQTRCVLKSLSARYGRLMIAAPPVRKPNLSFRGFESLVVEAA